MTARPNVVAAVAENACQGAVTKAIAAVPAAVTTSPKTSVLRDPNPSTSRARDRGQQVAAEDDPRLARQGGQRSAGSFGAGMKEVVPGSQAPASGGADVD